MADDPLSNILAKGAESETNKLGYESRSGNRRKGAEPTKPRDRPHKPEQASSVTKTNNMATDNKRQDEQSKPEADVVSKTDFFELAGKVDKMFSMLDKWAPAIKEMSEAFHAAKEDEEAEEEEEEQIPVTNNSCSKQMPVTTNAASEDDEASTSDDYLSNMISSTKTGPNLSQTTVDNVSGVLIHGLDSKIRDDIFSKYQRPDNFERLEVIDCDKHIYQSVSKKHRLDDKAVQKIQEDLTKALIASTIAYDKMPSTKNTKTKEMLADSLTLVANASHSLDLYRRHQLKPELALDFQGICASDRPVNKTLFGEYSSEIKDCTEAAKLVRKISKPKIKRRFNPIWGSGSRRWGSGRFKSYPSNQNHQNQKKSSYKQKSSNNNSSFRKHQKRY